MRRVRIIEDGKNTLERLGRIVVSCGEVEASAWGNAADAYKYAMEAANTGK